MFDDVAVEPYSSDVFVGNSGRVGMDIVNSDASGYSVY